MRLLAFVTVLLCAPLAHAQGVIDMGGMPEQEAKSHFKVGKSLYESGRFAEAAAEWSRAYELTQRVELLYNIYVAYRDASDLPHGIDALRRYLQGAELDDATRVNLQARLRAMEDSNAKGPVVAVTPSEPAPAQPPAQPAEPAPDAAPGVEATPVSAPTPAPTDSSGGGGGSIAPFVLYGVAGGLLIAASVTGIVVMGNEKDIEDRCPGDKCSDPDTIDKLDSTKTLAVVTDVLWITGVVAAGLGTAILLVDGGSNDNERNEHAASSLHPIAALGCGPHACAASVSGRF